LADDGRNMAQVIVALVAARGAIDSALLALSEEQKASEASEAPKVVTEDAQSTSAVPETCQHKNRQKIPSFGTTEHWICDDCGYEFIRR
jgi:transposase-like protein